MNTLSPVKNSPRRSWRLLIGIWLIISLACSLPGLGAKTPTAIPETTQQVATPKALPNLPPALVEINPLPASEIGLLAPLTLYFNQPMLRESVQAALSLSPAVEGVFEWLDDATMRFTPKIPLPISSEITLTVAKTAQAQNGIALSQEAQVVYRTPSALTVTQQIPAPDSSEVNPATAVVVAFNRPVVPLQAENAGSGPAAFSLEPAVEGEGSWLNTSTYIFHPTTGLGGGVSYTVRMNTELVSVDGLSLDAEQITNWSFSTSTPQVIASTRPEIHGYYCSKNFQLNSTSRWTEPAWKPTLSLQSLNGELYPFGLYLGK